jgi:hypothetical protein
MCPSRAVDIVQQSRQRRATKAPERRNDAALPVAEVLAEDARLGVRERVIAHRAPRVIVRMVHLDAALVVRAAVDKPHLHVPVQRHEHARAAALDANVLAVTAVVLAPAVVRALLERGRVLAVDIVEVDGVILAAASRAAGMDRHRARA